MDELKITSEQAKEARQAIGENVVEEMEMRYGQAKQL
jgi:hypothetical protein